MERSTERVLITGGEGFLGQHLQRWLKSHAIPFDTLDRFGNPTYRWDIRSPLPITMGDYGRVIHLAGLLGTHELFADVHRAIDVNIHGTVNVVKACARERIPFHGITMDHVWTNPYETTKLAAERLAQAWGREYGFPVKYTTVYNAYGEWQAHGPGHPQKIIPTFARAAHDNQPIPIWGDGEQVVDLIYAGHVAEILGLGLDVDGGYGMPLTVNEVARMVWDIVHPGEEPKIEYKEMRMGEHTPTRDPVARKPIHDGWDLPVTLRKTVDWYA